MHALRQGLIVKAQSGFFTVDAGGELVVCQLRGKLKQGRAKGDIAALGDRYIFLFRKMEAGR